MTSANSSNYDSVAEDLFQSYHAFQSRMEELEQILKARDALATLKYVDESLTNRKELSRDGLISEIAQYSRSNPSRTLDYHAINEATVVLLSAYLEGFIEELHTEAMRQLLDERVKSSGVLEALLEYAQERFGNPILDRIAELFSTCCIENIISTLKIDKGEIGRFLKIRNQVAHGEHPPVAGQDVETWVKLVLRFAEELSWVVEGEIIAMKL